MLILKGSEITSDSGPKWGPRVPKWDVISEGARNNMSLWAKTGAERFPNDMLFLRGSEITSDSGSKWGPRVPGWHVNSEGYPQHIRAHFEFRQRIFLAQDLLAPAYVKNAITVIWLKFHKHLSECPGAFLYFVDKVFGMVFNMVFNIYIYTYTYIYICICIYIYLYMY